MEKSGIKVSALIPCLNEENTLRSCILKAQQAFKEMGVKGEVVVGDNGSTDCSIEIAENLGATVAHERRRGYGAAVQAAAARAKGKYLIMADADDSYDWSDIAPFIMKLDEGYDFVMGDRFRGGILPGAMPFLHRHIGNPLLSAMARFCYGTKVGDFHCGMRAFTRAAYEKMNLKTRGMEFATEMVVRASHEKMKIAEVPVRLYPDKRGRPPHLRTFRDGWRHLRFIMSYAPNYLYLTPGFSLLGIGLILQIALVRGPIHVGDFYIGDHFLALGLLFTLIGLNTVTQGIVAKVALLGQTARQKNTLVTWLKNHFTLERGLIFGGLIAGIGLLIDGYLLVKWLGGGGVRNMESSVSLAFVCTGMIAIGVNILFTSFLLGLLLNSPVFQRE
jgi:glycosyltransferase involved in cell wall biosynthesis